MTDAQIEQALTELTGARRVGDALTIVAEAPSFLEGIDLVAAAARAAEQANHHPDIDIRWRTVRFVLSTHSEGGITELDVGLAARILELASGLGATVSSAGAGDD